MNVTKLTWRDVFDSEKKFHGHISIAHKLAKESGYNFFCWGGWVYDIEKIERVKTLEQLGLI